MLLTMISVIFFQLKHPLSMGFFLLIQTFNICLLIGISLESFWFSYILFIVFIGGMLVMFIYVTSLASNEKFKFSPKLIFFSLFFVLVFIILLEMNMNILNFESNILSFSSLLKENYLIIKKLYSFPTNLITIFSINFLFLTLIVSVKVTNFFYGPIRNLN
uniref:NADH-ubiquinone oxidoreductase chain 6 n=1 Tax=Diptera sp. 69 LC-2017 TaxID=2030347 RepID=A0A343LA27_9DIPT|nr:NADH dehydrogenase subunit 6 [Diptera sp. 69 LC-2017]